MFGGGMMRAAWLFGALLLAGGAHAAPLKVMGTQIELPFGFEVQKSWESNSRSYGLRANRLYELLVTDGDAKGSTIRVNALYYSPDRVEAGVVQKWMRDEAEKAAADKNTRAVQPFQVDGFGFEFIEGSSRPADFPERMTVVGVVNGATYRVTVFARDARALSPALAANLKAIRLDYPELLRLKSDFESESSVAIANGRVETPLGSFALPSGVDAHLSGSWVERDGKGRVDFRRSTFGMHKVGFWTIQNLAFSVSCGADQPDLYPKFIGMTEEQKDDDEKDRYTNVSAPQPAVLAGIPGETASASGTQIGFRHADVTRWVAHRDGRIYMAQVERLNGALTEISLNRQLASAAPECHLDMPSAVATTSSAAAAPAASSSAK